MTPTLARRGGVGLVALVWTGASSFLQFGYNPIVKQRTVSNIDPEWLLVFCV